MLHLPRGVALGVQVGELLELERSLQGDGIVDAAAEEEEVLVGGHLLGKLGDCRLLLEGLLHETRQLEQTLDVLAAVLGEEGAAATAEPEGEEIAGGEGGRESLGRRHADLRPRVGVEHSGGLALQRRPHHVGDAHDGRAAVARSLDRP